MAGAVGTDLLDGATCVDTTVGVHDIVIADVVPAEALMVAADALNGAVGIGAGGGAMEDTKNGSGACVNAGSAPDKNERSRGASTLVPVACGRGRRAARRGGLVATGLVVDFPRHAVRNQGAAHHALLAHRRHRALRRELHAHVAYQALARVRLLVHHRRRHLVAERPDALQFHRAAVLHVQLHDFRQRQQHRHHVRGRSRRRVGDVLAQLFRRDRVALRHGSHRPLLAALPFAFDFLDKSHVLNALG